MNASLMDIKFVGLMCAVAVIRPLLPRRWYAPFGAIASAMLIGLASPPTLVAIAAITLGYLYPLHLAVCYYKRRNIGHQLSKRWLIPSIAGLVAMMFLFKANQAFTLPLLGNSPLGQELLSLIGFSYFLFRAINFLYIQQVFDLEEKSPWSLLFYVLFPPTVTSGPIQRYVDFRDQLADPQPLSASNVKSAIYRITRGYFRKVVLAYVFHELLTSMLATENPVAYTSVLAMVSQYVSFYFDFAGYTDIAIGFGMLLGIKVPENFKMPFLATSISEFWRNWHITLMAWFRDHVFLPFGGARSKIRGACLALMVMVLCGLWHGITWMFLGWGLLHGLMLAFEHVQGIKPMPRASRHGVSYWSKIACTNTLVACSMIFFLPDSDSMFTVLEGLTRWW